MNKKTIILLIIVIICIALTCFLVFSNIFKNNNNNQNENVSSTEKEQENNNNITNSSNVINTNNATNNENNNNNDITSQNKSLVLYFSATGTTKKIAEYIKDETSSDIIEIIPKEEYTSDDLNYNKDCRANREQNDETARPEMSNTIDISNYDVTYLGYPIWWGDVPKIILTLLESNDFSGKTIVPFCTSGGSSITKSVNTLKNYKNINWLEGETFNSRTTQKDIQLWIDELG